LIFFSFLGFEFWSFIFFNLIILIDLSIVRFLAISFFCFLHLISGLRLYRNFLSTKRAFWSELKLETLKLFFMQGTSFFWFCLNFFLVFHFNVTSLSFERRGRMGIFLTDFIYFRILGLFIWEKAFFWLFFWKHNTWATV
jgi:hypothetical protein